MMRDIGDEQIRFSDAPPDLCALGIASDPLR
jgi:hypothetical protein